MTKKKARKQEDRSTVAMYLHFGELRSCLASGWSASLAREYLIERHGPDGVPHERAIQRWRDKHMDITVRIVPHQVIEKKLKGIDYKVDVVAHLSRLIALCEDRVGRGLEQEDQFGIPLAVNDGVIQVYLQAMAQYVKVAQDLGIMKSPPQVPLIDARTQNLNVTPETLKALRDTVAEIKRLETGGA